MYRMTKFELLAPVVKPVPLVVNPVPTVPHNNAEVRNVSS